MTGFYGDILSRISEEPKWWDSNGTPRYDEFHPKYCPDIYSNTVVLLRIECQYCGEPFDVEMHSSIFGSFVPQKLHYGDPPVHGCPGGGDTMNCEDIEVLQVWHRERAEEWKRLPKHEGKMA